ncbi:MAG: hypothetical protein M3065_19745 [Actinomycetota bacterium]|nr:hypothetical protein [Actinomycetota bacterium]
MQVEVVVSHIPEGTPEYEAAVQHDEHPAPPTLGQKMPPHRHAQPVSKYVQQFGGDYVGRMLFPPTGENYTVDLGHWRNADPDATYISVEFHWIDPAKVGTRRFV